WTFWRPKNETRFSTSRNHARVPLRHRYCSLCCNLRNAAGSATMALASNSLQSSMSSGFQGASPNARFLVGDVPEGEHGKLRVGNALSFSFLSHVVGLLIAVFMMSLPGAPPGPPASFEMPKDIVWVAQEGPGGG